MPRLLPWRFFVFSRSIFGFATIINYRFAPLFSVYTHVNTYKLCIVICILSSNPAIQDSVHFWLKRVTIEYVGKLGSNPADSQNWHFGSLFFRKNLGTKKAEKSLEISAFLLFSRSVFFRTAHMAGAIGIEPTQWESEAQVLPLHQAPSYELLYITKDCFAIDFLCRNKKITAQMIFFEIIDLFLLQK